MAARRYRLEVWDRTGSARRAIFGAVLRAERRQVLKGEETLVVDVPADDPAVAELRTGAVLRLQEEGSATGFSLWRLTSHRKARGRDGALQVQITADALWMDLRQGLVRQRLADGRSQFTFGLVGLTPRQWLEDVILPGYDGDAIAFQVGVVEPTAAVDLSFDRTTPLGALRMLEEAVPGGAEAQFRLSPDGSSYFVDLLHRVGQFDGGAELRYAKNVAGLERLEDEADVQTRLYATGSGLLTLADAEWKIGALSGPTGARVIAFDGPHPVFEDGAHVGLWWYVPGKGAYPITASSASTGTLTVNGSGLPALAAGDVGWIATDQEGSRLEYLESPSARALYGVRVGELSADDVPDAINLLANGDLSAEASGLPAAWSKLGSPTVAKVTDPIYARHGGVAWRVQASADGEGLISDPFQVPALADRPYTALRVGLTAASGKVRVELRHSNGQVYPVSQRPSSEGLGVYLELTAGPVHDEPLPAGTAQLAIVAHGGPADVYVDCAMVTPVVGSDVPAFVAGSGAHLLWQRAAAELADRSRPRVEYRVDVVDLHRIDPDAFRFDELRLGDSVRLHDPDIAVDTVRIVELVQDLVRAEATSVVLAAGPRHRVHDPYAPPSPPIGGRQPDPGPGAPSQERPAVLQLLREWRPADGRLRVGAIGSATVATLELRTRTDLGAPWPATPTATIAGRQGWFDPPIEVPAGTTLYFQVTPRDGRGAAGDPVEDSVFAPGIPDGAVDIAKFAQGIKPVAIVDQLPPNGDLFQVVLLTTDHKLYRWDGTQWTAAVPAADIDGQLIADQIADGAIDTAKFAAGIRPVEIVDELPATGEEGQVVLLTTDHKIYRWDGSRWTAAVPATDITGQISGNQIANGAVTLAKFASGIRPVEIVSSLPTPGTAGRIVYLTADGKLYRDTGSAWTAAVPAGDITGQISTTQISDDAITAPKIAANAVTAAKIQAGAVEADKIAAGAVTAGKIAAGAVSASELAAGAVTTDKIAANAVTAERIAANAVQAGHIAAGQINANHLAADSVTAGAIAAGAVSTSELAAGAVTTQKLAAGAVTANELAANAVTAAKIQAGAIQSSHIAAGQITAAHLAADSVTAGAIAAGAVSTSELAAGAVTADKLAVGQLSAISADLGDVTAGVLRGPDNGLVVDANNRLITVRDQQPTPVQRVKLGKLGTGAADYGIEIYNAAGQLVFSRDGQLTQAIDVPKGAQILEVMNGQEWSYAAYGSTPPLVSYIGGGMWWDSRNRWSDILLNTYANGGAGTGSQPPVDSGPYAIVPRFYGEVLPNQQIKFHAYLMAISSQQNRSASFTSPAIIGLGDRTGPATLPTSQLPAQGDQFFANYTISVSMGPTTESWQVSLNIVVEVSTNGGSTWQSVASVWNTVSGTGSEAREEPITLGFASGLTSQALVRLAFQGIQVTPSWLIASAHVQAGTVTWNQITARYASATPTTADRARFLILAQR